MDSNVIPFDPGKGRRKGADPERMRELTRIRLEKAAARKREREDAIARGEAPPVNGVRSPTDKEIRERAVQTAADLLNHARAEAVKVLTDQLKHKDPAIRQRAATKVLEYTDGKPTQTIVSTTDNVTKVVYETAALTGWAEPFTPGAS